MTTTNFKKVWKRIFKYFLEGLILIAPISITIYALYKIFEILDGILHFKILSCPKIGLHKKV